MNDLLFDWEKDICGCSDCDENGWDAEDDLEFDEDNCGCDDCLEEGL